VAAPVSDSLLEVTGLNVVYYAEGGALPVLRDVELALGEAEIVGIVGESGCGKSTLSTSILRLLPPNGAIVGGSMRYRGRDIVGMSEEEVRDLRGAEISMIFQDPLSSLNPTFTVWAQLRDAVLAHPGAQSAGRGLVRRRAVEAFADVGIPDANDRLDDYPHQFSGGMRQRIMIAAALLLEPAMLIADEPTSALDVTLQAQILSLLSRLRRTHRTAILFISHDLGLVAQLCDRVVVMYCGQVVESGLVVDVYDRPRHPYTRALLASIPSRDRRGDRLAAIPGRVPGLSALPPGCAFSDRCHYAQSVCRERAPDLVADGTHGARCLAYDPESGHTGLTGSDGAASSGAGVGH
jgi:oligopeptide/dipeptide ABC transporter ATP-binding protein